MEEQTTKELEMWTDGFMYKNAVIDAKTHKLRNITEAEKDIVSFCFSYDHHYNEACAELGYATFELEPYKEEDIISAAEVILVELSHESGKRNKLAKYKEKLFTEIPDYLEVKEKEGLYK